MCRWNPDFTRAALAALLGVFLLAGCARREPAAEPLLRLSQRNEPATLDPHLATLPDEFFLLRAMLEGLVVPDPDGGPPLPGAARAWTTSDDGLRWTFRLRDDARWSNGDRVTAHDFVYSVRRALTPALGAPQARNFHVLRHAAAYQRGELTDVSAIGCSAPDERTLVLELEHPTPHLLALLASGPWLPVHPGSVERHGGAAARDGAWTRPGHFVGNGPFVLAEWRRDQHLLARPNPHYHARDRVHVAGLRFQIYDNGDTEERAFRAGQVDVTMAVPTAKLDTYAKPVLRRQPLHETRYLAANTRRPPLDDPRVRRALALALDRERLIGTVLRGGQAPALHFVPPGLGGYTPAGLLAPDPAAAREALAAAGFPGGHGFPRLELSAWGISPSLLEAVQQMWRRELGIEVALVQREGRVHMASVLAGDFTLALMPAIPDFADPAALLEELTTGAPGNLTGWTDAPFDQLVTLAGRTTDPVRRQQLYREAEARLLDTLPVIPLYFNTQNYLVAPRVRGWRQDALWNRTYLDVSLD